MKLHDDLPEPRAQLVHKVVLMLPPHEQPAFGLITVTFLSVLNSRQLLTKRGVDIFGANSPTERNLISRAQRLPASERDNVPQRCELPEHAPTWMDIKVATEVEKVDGYGVESLSPSRK